MVGPMPAGHWTRSRPPGSFKHLEPGLSYAVRRAFTDHDGATHPAGERWIYLGHNFLPYDDGLSLFVSLDGVAEWHIRMQWREEEQGPVIDALHEYVEAAA